MKYILTMIMCSVIEGQTTCIPPFHLKQDTMMLMIVW